MKPFFIETQVRWADLDVNRHMANASYMNFTSHARISYLRILGLNMNNLAEYNIGPAVLREELSFFKEIMEGQNIIVTVEQSGISEHGEMFEFTHNFYNKENGEHMAFSKLFGVWFSMDKRKITPPPPAMLEKLKKAINIQHVRKLSIADLKNLPVKPQDIDISTFL